MFNILKDFGFPAYVVGVIALISLSYKKTKEFQERNLKTTKEQLDSIIDLFSDKEKFNNTFLIEQVFNYKFKTYIPARVILRFLDTANPTSSINDYIFGKRHVEFKFNDIDLSYRENMKDPKIRKKWKVLNLIGYSIFASLSFGLLFSLTSINKYLGYSWLIASIPLQLYFIWVAYEFIISTLRITAAERIMEEIEYKEENNNTINRDKNGV